jgi:membrane protein
MRARAARGKRSLWKLGGLRPLELARRLLQGMMEDELLTRAAALSFYFIFALFPMALSLMAILGILAQARDLHTSLLYQFGQLVPPSALALFEDTIRELTRHSSGWKLAFGLLLALWSGSSGMSSIMDALNRCYDVRDSRPYWKRLLISLGLTATISALTLAALAIVLFGGSLVEFLAGRIGLSHFAVELWQFAEWPIALIFVLFSLTLVYYLAPDKRGRWHWLTPGSVVGVLAWVAASLLLRAYLHFFNSYSRTYGSLGAVMILLLWLYLTGLAILVGGKINAEIELAEVWKAHH